MADEEKTEEPTAKRRSQAREQGNVAKSQDLSAGVMLLASVLLIGWYALDMLGAMKTLMVTMFTSGVSADVTRTGDLAQMWAIGLNTGVRMVLPIMGGIFVIGLLINVYQVGLLLTLKPIEPNPNKLSPMKGIKQMVSLRSWVRLIMSLLKLSIVLAVAVVIMKMHTEQVLALILLNSAAAFASAAAIVYDVAFWVAVMLLILGIIDFVYQKWQHVKDMRMSKHEIKEEMKQMEGDQLVKQRRAKVARQLALQRIADAVPQADVVVTNPTHVSVALAYDDDKMDAPKVVAKGADYLAWRIRQIAMVEGIPLVERPELARALYRDVEAGEEIPSHFYKTVAEILAYVYQLDGKMKQPKKIA